MSAFRGQPGWIAALIERMETMLARVGKVIDDGGNLRGDPDNTVGIFPSDASIVTYTPAELTDWDGDADPGNVDGALDQLAERVETLEDAGSGGGSGGIIPVLHDGLQYQWVNQPAGETELFGLTVHRIKLDLSGIAEARLVVNVLGAGAAGSELRVQYSTDESSWDYLDGGTGPSVAIDATGVEVSPSVMLDPAAQADVFLRVVGIDGDAAADPVFGSIAIECEASPTSAPADAVFVLGEADAALPNAVVREWLTDNHDPDAYPASPNALDDEFEGGGAIDAKWTKVNDPAGANAINQTDFAGFVHVGLLELGTDNFDNAVRMYQAPPASSETWDIQGKLTSVVSADGMQADGGEFSGMALYLANSTNDQFIGMGIEINIGTLARPMTASAYVDSGGLFSAVSGRQVIENLIPGKFYYFRLTKTTTAAYTSANTYNFYFSGDGRIWQHVATISKAFTTACDEIGLLFRRPKSQAGTPKAEAMADFFRRVA